MKLLEGSFRVYGLLILLSLAVFRCVQRSEVPDHFLVHLLGLLLLFGSRELLCVFLNQIPGKFLLIRFVPISQGNRFSPLLIFEVLRVDLLVFGGNLRIDLAFFSSILFHQCCLAVFQCLDLALVKIAKLKGLIFSLGFLLDVFQLELSRVVEDHDVPGCHVGLGVKVLGARTLLRPCFKRQIFDSGGIVVHSPWGEQPSRLRLSCWTGGLGKAAGRLNC